MTSIFKLVPAVELKQENKSQIRSIFVAGWSIQLCSEGCDFFGPNTNT